MPDILIASRDAVLLACCTDDDRGVRRPPTPSADRAGTDGGSERANGTAESHTEPG